MTKLLTRTLYLFVSLIVFYFWKAEIRTLTSVKIQMLCRVDKYSNPSPFHCLWPQRLFSEWHLTNLNPEEFYNFRKITCSRSLQTTTDLHRRVNRSVKEKNVSLLTENLSHQITPGGEGGRRHHMSSCWADITFYPISNLWNNTGSSMSEPLTSPVTAL